MATSLAVYLALYGLICVGMIAAGYLARRNSLRRSPPRSDLPPVTVVKPVRGLDASTVPCFRSWLAQEYPAPVQFIFSFQDSADPALAIVEQMRAEFPDRDVLSIVNPIRTGYGGKTSNLQHGVEQAKHQTYVFSDADIYATPGTLRDLVTRMPQDGVICCLPKHTRPTNLWGRCYATAWNLIIFCFWAPAVAMRKPDGLAGGTIALTRDSLARLGGLEAVANSIAEDLEMGRRAREAGLSIVLGPPVTSPIGRMTFGQLWEKFTRASAVLVSSGKTGGPAAPILVHLAFYAYIPGFFLGIAFHSKQTVIASLIVLAMRSLFAGGLVWLADGVFRTFWGMIVLDCVYSVCFAYTLATRRLTWGGVSYRVGDQGRMHRL